MKLYKIRNWNEIYENNRSRTVDDLSWVKIPNRHDGENYSMIITSIDGSKIFSAWILMVQVASRCQPRGTLIRDNRQPHTPVSLSVKTRAPSEWFEKALEFISNETDWLEVEEFNAHSYATVSQVTGDCQSGDEEGKRRKGMEWKGREEREVSAVRLLQLLNYLTGRKFREVGASLIPIMERLSEPGVTEEGCHQMIVRQVANWKDDAKMSEFLRPETLFRKSKFNSYYAAKDLPPNEANKRNNPERFDRNKGTHNEGKTDAYSAAAAKSQARSKESNLPGL